jgi:hypothetical protein
MFRVLITTVLLASGGTGEQSIIDKLLTLAQTVAPPLAILSLVAVGIFQYILSPLLPNTNKGGVRNILVGMVIVSAATTIVTLFADIN